MKESSDPEKLFVNAVQISKHNSAAGLYGLKIKFEEISCFYELVETPTISNITHWITVSDDSDGSDLTYDSSSERY